MRAIDAFFVLFLEENLELMEDLNVIDLIVDAIKMHKKVCWTVSVKRRQGVKSIDCRLQIF